MSSVHGHTERKLIVLNELHQPIGPTEAVVKELSSFLVTLARNGTFCPLNVLNWKELKTQKDMWNYIKNGLWMQFNLLGEGTREGLRKNTFMPMTMTKRPKNVPKSVFKDLLRYWNSDEAENTSKTNK